MAPYRALNVKQMYSSLFTCKNQKELDQLFNAFQVMLDHGFISPHDYQRFHELSCGVEFHLGHLIDIYTTP